MLVWTFDSSYVPWSVPGTQAEQTPLYFLLVVSTILLDKPLFCYYYVKTYLHISIYRLVLTYPGYPVRGILIGVRTMNRYKTGAYYRERAEECRVLSEWLTSEDLKKKMVKTAEDYERMAEAIEWIILVRGEGQ